MLRPDDLVGLPDFEIGSLTVSPSRRIVERDDRNLSVEPRVMQFLVILAQNRGQVVTRQKLFDEIWGGVAVGDDSLNRAAAGARKALSLDPHLVMETVPRTGYRLHAGLLDTHSRRDVLAGGALATMLVVGGLGYWAYYKREDTAFDEYMRRGNEALAYQDRGPAASEFFERAVKIRSDDARAQGLLAYSQANRSDVGNPKFFGALDKAERAAAAALLLDPKQPDALLARILMQRSMLDFAETEERLRAILDRNPENVRGMKQLWELLQCVGRSHESLELVNRALKTAPLSAANNFPLAQLLWITGRVAESDRVIDRAMAYWPKHPYVRFARYTIFAFTGRPRAAMAMLENPRFLPGNFTVEILPLLKANLTALDEQSSDSIDVAVRANLEAARVNPQLTPQATMTLSALGRIDEAFEIANILFVGTETSPEKVDGEKKPSKGTSWRSTPWMFTPPIAAMRSDPRFNEICDAAGLTDYWIKRGIRPDYQLEQA